MRYLALAIFQLFYITEDLKYLFFKFLCMVIIKSSTK